MMSAAYWAVALGGAFGAMARYSTVLFAQNTWGLRFPYGTLLVNNIGSFIAGFLLVFFSGRFSANEFVRLFFFTGFLGAYTTFSSFCAESLLLFQEEQWLKLAANIFLNNAGSLLMVFLGALMAHYLSLGSFHQP